MDEKKFEFLEHMGDAYIAAYGETLEEAFSNAGLAMFEVMTDTKLIEPKLKDEIKVEGEDEIILLHNWLEALLLKFEIELKLYSRFNVKKIERKNGNFLLEAEVFGEIFNRNKHLSKTEVKAVTYHQMSISQEAGKFTVKFILDL
ncbi:MAG: archease [Candidatus Bathyarchaeia archaeon]|nr:archease [Candidatus Bathyarchaeota archaeon]